MLSGVGDPGSTDSVEEGDYNENDNEVDEYGNNKFEKGTYESYGHSDDDSDDNQVRGIVNEDDEEEDEGGSESEEEIRKYKTVKITKNVKIVKKKDLKRRRKEESDDENNSDNEDDNMSTADLQRQEALALKMLRTA